MAWFHFGKKEKESKTPSCCCAKADNAVKPACGCGTEAGQAESACCCGKTAERIESVKVLGTGCKLCHEQYENAKAAVAALGLSVEAEYVTDMEKIMAYGVMQMPALVVNEQVVARGKVLKAAEVEKLLQTYGK